jgi:hypothetical protein
MAIFHAPETIPPDALACVALVRLASGPHIHRADARFRTGGLLPTSPSDDQAAPLHERGSAAVDDCSTVLADPDPAIYRRLRS